MKDIKIVDKSLSSFIPKRRSERRNKKTASQKKENKMIPIKAKIQDSQKGINKIDNSSTKEAKILSIIPLYYTLNRKKQTRKFDARQNVLIRLK